jgi:hypothetical protein
MKSNQIRANWDSSCDLKSKIALTGEELVLLKGWTSKVAAADCGRPQTRYNLNDDVAFSDLTDLIVQIANGAVIINLNIELGESERFELADIVGQIALRMGFDGAGVLMRFPVRGEPNEDGICRMYMARQFGQVCMAS